jgi:glycosyltransferase involved in cell wall biosynthesis
MRILALAYACDPSTGSEPGAGWVWARLLTRFGSVHVITRSNNRRAIEAALPGLPERDRLRFSYVEGPALALRLKRGQRGVRTYYLLWQLAALAEARRLDAAGPFDLVWHLTMANAWLGSSGALAGPPFVFGPVGGGQSVPARLLPSLGARGAAAELARSATRLAHRHANPLGRLARRRAVRILALNDTTRDWFPPGDRDRVAVTANAVLEPELLRPRPAREPGKPLTAVYAGRLLAWKAPAIALRALAQAPGWRLELYGAGPEAARLTRLADRLGIADRVELRLPVPRAELLERMRAADAFLFPSLRDDSPWVVAEALACGLPVLCAGRGGPPAIAGPAALTVASRSPAGLAAGLAAHLRRLADEGVRARLHEAALARAAELTIDRRAEAVAELVGLDTKAPVE